MIVGLIHLVIWIIVVGLIVWLLIYALDAISPPEPFHRVGRAMIIVIACLIVILLLLQVLGVAGLDIPKLP